MTYQPAPPMPPAPPVKTGHGKLIAVLVGAVLLAAIAAGQVLPKASPSDSPSPAAEQPLFPDTSGSVAESGTATEQALCAALGGPVKRLPPLIDAVSNDAESGISLSLEGLSLELHLSMTNNAAKIAGDIQDMRDTCASQAG